MGQSSSRQQRPPSVATPPQSQSTPADPSAQPARTPRRSVRRSLLNLVKPSQSHTDSNRRLRNIKSWRKSRRWSKAPDSDHSTPTSPSSVPQSLPSSSATLPVESLHSDNDRLPKSDDGDERSHDFEVPRGVTVAESEGQSGSSHPSLPAISSTMSEHTAVDSEGPREHLNAPEAPVAYPGPPAEPTPTTTPPLAPQPPTTAQQQQSQQQFQPPGTLVVVQGVVHTTDVPRPTPQASQATQTAPEVQPRSSSTPPSSTNRLSTLLQPSSSTLNTQQAADDTPMPQPGPGQSSPAAAAEAALLSDSESGTISSGSIDVLGTLLSVAAAATAASLLTGTTEGLNLPPNIGGSSTESRPTSPTPTSGLDSTRGLRQAWGGIRERLGLRPQSSSSSSPSPSHSQANSTSTSTSTSTHSTTEPTTDPREHLFSQMARAFNLGLGLATESAAAARDGNGTGVGVGLGLNSTSQTQTQSQSPSGEGSFERFLTDLQTDLRTALSGPPNAAPAASTTTTENVETTLRRTRPSGEETQPPPLVPGHGQNRERLSPLEVPLPDDDFDEEEDHGEDNASMPELRSVIDSELDSDSDSDFEDASEDMHGHHAAESRHATPTPLQGSHASPETPVPEANHNGRINWWRLYRFDSISIPSAHGQRLPIAVLPSAAVASTASTPPSTQASPSSPSTTSASPVNVAPSLAELPFADSASTTTTSTSESAGPHVVVPVIVVGVQSVPANWPGSPGPAVPAVTPEDTAPMADQPPFATPYSSTTGDSGIANTDGVRGRGGWPSRAADAIRNLRPGSARRNRNAISTNTGSRTFLIYVIGGYYPPNHGILTGGPETLASLEALLELADLFGHGKPPTATKEEIDGSGLEIIKTTQLEQYEREEKISSNCTERCLICLDDYEPEDDIRIMKCRHAFHQNCVDKWLETGRNNCPACRSKGVSLDDAADA